MAKPNLPTGISAKLRRFLRGEDWHFVDGTNEPAFQGVWENYPTTYDNASFFMDSNSIVHLNGLVRTTSGTGAGTTVFTLPEDYRPTNALIFATLGTNAAARVEILANGDVELSASLGDGTSWLTLNGISFKAT